MNLNDFSITFNKEPEAQAVILGSKTYSNIKGKVFFYPTEYGVIVVAAIEGLPTNLNNSIFAFHIHEGTSCSGTNEDPFLNAGTHYNPQHLPHPQHAGDLPPLFSADGNAFMAVLSNRFSVNEIIGKTIIIHSSYDDFTTQPAGNSGIKIACGKIEPFTA